MRQKRKIKYLVIPGYVSSINDRDIHRISARELMNLYGVKLEECIILYDERNKLSFRGQHNLFILGPLRSGRYMEVLDKYKKIENGEEYAMQFSM